MLADAGCRGSGGVAGLCFDCSVKSAALLGVLDRGLFRGVRGTAP